MTALDWLPVAGMLAILVAGLGLSRGQMRSVADFLAAGRSADRYLVSVASGVAALGSITIIGNLEMHYVSGFTLVWWGLSLSIVVLGVHLSGWVLYRFRQTRCLTVAEFFERRYGRSFRVFAGSLAWLSGIVNFGIFPAVGTRFFIHYCGLPATVAVAGEPVSTFALLMAALLLLTLGFVFLGGQVAVIVTNFLQGTLVNLIFLALGAYLLVRVVSWDQIAAALGSAPAEASLVDPFRASRVEDFNVWYFAIGAFGVVYGQMSWQGTQAYNASASSAHEARMSQALALWKTVPQSLFLLVAAVAIYTILHHPDFARLAAEVNGVLAGHDREALRSQLRPALVLRAVLPPGLLGAFAAVMLACFLSTHESYLHSWGSIFVQDVLLPLRHDRPLTPRQHLLALRLSILGVAAFAFAFSLLFRQSQYIFLFFAITGAIFAGGSGAVIIGGLYWRRGTARAAWSALAVGALISVGGIVLQQLDPDFPVNGQVFWGIAMGVSSVVYVVVSLVGPRAQAPVDLDRLLHRAASTAAPPAPAAHAAPRGWGRLAFTSEFTRGDKVLYGVTGAWILGWFAVFIAGTAAGCAGRLDTAAWLRFWRVYLAIQFVAALVVCVWFTAGGTRDLARMLRRLGAQVRDQGDDGIVR
ncbi:MAG TPA: sodium:solute symporter [Candidatus Krumholzibacteria bacterium]|nr:sodium:solute symporter [Candidatus Krumholzibacteria bacterium]HPD70635.1 sodium:solute symporter [Candidatus Krumholzibacteria bacterium]HRY39665.1 sodium:solute symporter [Candidatus Krumholzibacteria bacterium]